MRQFYLCISQWMFNVLKDSSKLGSDKRLTWNLISDLKDSSHQTNMDLRDRVMGIYQTIHHKTHTGPSIKNPTNSSRCSFYVRNKILNDLNIPLLSQVASSQHKSFFLLPTTPQSPSQRSYTLPQNPPQGLNRQWPRDLLCEWFWYFQHWQSRASGRPSRQILHDMCVSQFHLLQYFCSSEN